MTIAGIPIRTFAGMARLDGHLPADARAALARAVATHVLDQVVAAGCEPVVVTSDAEVGTWARSRDALGADRFGYRRELLNLVKRAQRLRPLGR